MDNKGRNIIYQMKNENGLIKYEKNQTAHVAGHYYSELYSSETSVSNMPSEDLKCRFQENNRNRERMTELQGKIRKK